MGDTGTWGHGDTSQGPAKATATSVSSKEEQKMGFSPFTSDRSQQYPGAGAEAAQGGEKTPGPPPFVTLLGL